MLKHIIDFYKVSTPAPCNGESLPEQKRRLKRLERATLRQPSDIVCTMYAA